MMAPDLTIEDLFSKEKFIFIAGPCAVESEEQVIETARFLKTLGINFMRGGAYKPRTSPKSFQGLKEEGLKILAMAKEETGINIVTEVMDSDNLTTVTKYADILQIGSRNCQNFSLLRRVGELNRPVLIKRGFGNTIDEFVQASEYISGAGNSQIIMVERGIRTFENATRFTLDISAVPVLKERVPYPVYVDPSHPAGLARYVEPLSLAAVGAGADGLMIEVHPEPQEALSDSKQQLNFKQFELLYKRVNILRETMSKF
ncbi:MAG: 3-deoxy-7-phosphoheptulonate synthase [Thermoplasmataceae archaeon]|jgi:3-deoxy-7-phosphoheptulonate synthase|nr:3-deoxy-7-phosphoheptulonate synthase [Candidatus Thermoplasmatota archaeon]MCL5787097.1 3-deoxy-7-phosphoheptulonate synthase [Candidatus Thermoplasmatota archaeon]